jgi:hypothetical protein
VYVIQRVRLLACINAAPTARIVMDTETGGSFEKNVDKIKI